MGSVERNPIVSILQPAAALATMPAPTSKIISTWRSSTSHTAFEHYEYAVARAVYRIDNETGADPNASLTDSQLDGILRKLTKTFTPVRKPSKLANGVTPFGSSIGYFVTVDGAFARGHLAMTAEEATRLNSVHSQLKLRFRQVRNDLPNWAPAAPPPRVKKPWTGPTTAH